MNRREKATRENGVQWRYDYNARGEVTSGVKAKGTATNAALRTGMQFWYEYDLIGNRLEESVHTPAGLAVQDWAANAGNQIIQKEIASSRWLLGRVHPEADLTVTGGGTAQREDWEFAVPVESTPAGTATWKQVTVTATREGAGENGADVEGTLEGNQWFAANPENMSYDEDGNLSSDGRWSYEWDGENRLKVMQTQPGAKAAGVPARRLEFAYDAQGRRIRKLVQSFELAEGPYTTIKDHRYIYDGWNMVAEFEVQGSPELTGAYAWGRDISGTMTGAGGVGGLVLAQKPKTGWTYAPCYDGNGNVSAYVSAASGAVRAKFDYDLYGRPIWNELAGGEELPAYRFSTKYEDVETGLLYYGYRYYAPELGRWISRDPIGEKGGVNLYGMVAKDPINDVDYLGQQKWTDFKAKIETFQTPKDMWNHYVADKVGKTTNGPYLITCFCGLVDLIHLASGVAATQSGRSPTDFMQERFDQEFGMSPGATDLQRATVGYVHNKGNYRGKAASADDHPSEALGALSGLNPSWQKGVIDVLTKCIPIPDDVYVQFVQDSPFTGGMSAIVDWPWSIPVIIAEKINKPCCPKFDRSASSDLRSAYLNYFKQSGLDWQESGKTNIGPVPPGIIK